jgi:hypothetical protein
MNIFEQLDELDKLDEPINRFKLYLEKDKDSESMFPIEERKKIKMFYDFKTEAYYEYPSGQFLYYYFYNGGRQKLFMR